MQQASRTHIITQRDVEMDTALPPWARRSNPVVRRELGPFWKRLFPDITLIGRIIGVELLLVVLPVQFLLTLTLPVAMLAVVMLPIVVLLHGRVLVLVINTAALSMANARAQHTLDLLRVTPLPPHHIVLGKIAASVWHRVEDIDMVLIGVTVFSLPFVLIRYLGSADEITLWMRFAVMLAVVGLPLRVVLEPFMVGAVALAVGAAVPSRAAAVVVTLGGLIFYYLLLLVPLAAPMALWLRVLWEVVLPVALSSVVIGITVGFSLWQLQRD